MNLIRILLGKIIFLAKQNMQKLMKVDIPINVDILLNYVGILASAINCHTEYHIIKKRKETKDLMINMIKYNLKH